MPRMLLAMAVLVAGASGLDARSVTEKGTPRERAEQAYYNDATALCKEFIPDESKITACMAAKRAQLSPACRKVFDEGL